MSAMSLAMVRRACCSLVGVEIRQIVGQNVPICARGRGWYILDQQARDILHCTRVLKVRCSTD
jgi:hypothetical protein